MLEHEVRKLGKPASKIPWGPPEYQDLVEESLNAFVDKYPLVPLQGAIRRAYPPQALIYCDCLGARWSEQSLLEHFANQQVLLPHAPGSTAFMQEPDTHEHAQLKAAQHLITPPFNNPH